MTSYLLASFHPLCATRAGRRAIEEHGYPHFVDGSFRRDPDLHHRWPAIAALNRGANFAPRLEPGDRVAFVTHRGRHKGLYGDAHWRLVALLRVALRFESHAEAAEWYTSRRMALPRNLIVPGNPPLPLDHSDGRAPHELPEDAPPPDADESAGKRLRAWDALCRARARRHGVVLACRPVFLELVEPRPIYAEEWVEWLGRVPVTRNPPQIGECLWQALCRHVEVDPAHG